MSNYGRVPNMELSIEEKKEEKAKVVVAKDYNAEADK